MKHPQGAVGHQMLGGRMIVSRGAGLGLATGLEIGHNLDIA